MEYPSVVKLVKNGELVEAFNECVKLLKASPNDEVLFSHGVNIGSQAGLTLEVENLIEEFCKDNPDSFEGQFSRGSYAFVNGKIDLAKSIFERMHEIDPENISVAIYLATANFTLDQKDSSVVEFIRPYLDKNPESVLLLYYYAIFLTEFKRNDELVAVLDKLKQLDEKLYLAVKEQIDLTNSSEA